MAGRRGFAAVCTVAVSVALLAVPVASARTLSDIMTSTDIPTSHTSALEAARVDGVATPNLGWCPVFGGAQCATAELPLDYDLPHGPTSTVAVVKTPAADPARKIG